MRERVDLKSPVRENRPPGSVRGAPGNRCPYRDIKCRTKAVEFGILGQTLARHMFAEEVFLGHR